MTPETTTTAPPGRDFRIYLVGQGISRFGSSFTTFAVPLVAYRLSGSPLSLGFTMVASFLPFLLFSLVIGAILDRADRKRLMITCELIRTAILVLLMVSVSMLHSMFTLYAGAFLMTTLSIAFNAGGFAAVPYLVDEPRIVKANAQLQFVSGLASFSGPAVAGAAVLAVTPQTLFLFDAATYLVSAVSLALIRTSFSEVTASGAAADGLRAMPARLGVDVRAGLRLVWSAPVLRSIAILMFWVNFLDASLFAQLIYFAKHNLAASDSQAAWMFGAAQLGGLVAAAVAGRVTTERHMGVRIVGSQLLCGLATIWFGLTHLYAIGILLWAAYSALSIWFNIHTSSLRQKIVPRELLSRVITVSSFLAWSAVPAGAAIGSVVIARFGHIGAIFAGIGVLTTLAAVTAVFGPLARVGNTPLRQLQVPATDDVRT